jgi:hypothetical protein
MLKHMIHLHSSASELLTVLKLWRKVKDNDAIFAASVCMICEEIYNLLRKADLARDEAKELFNRCSNCATRQDITDLYGEAISLQTNLL